jgi:hypothetical protein
MRISATPRFHHGTLPFLLIRVCFLPVLVGYVWVRCEAELDKIVQQEYSLDETV